MKYFTHILILSVFAISSPTIFADTTTNANLVLVKGTYAPPLDNLLNAMSADIHWIEMAGGPYGGIYTGKEAILENVFSHFGKDWEGFHPEPDNFVANYETVVVTGTYKGKFKPTGLDLAARFTHVFTLDKGKVIRFEQFTDTQLFDEAIAPR